MAYRQTEKVKAHLEARRHAILAASIDVIAKHGFEGLTVANVAARAGIAVGLIYKYFPDMTELFAAVVAHLLERDLKAMRGAADLHKDPLRALAFAITVFYCGLDNPRLVRAMADAPGYRLGIREELARLMREARPELTPRERKMAAAGALGAIYGVFDVSDGSEKNALAAVLFVFRGLGVSDAVARKVAA
jgi:AcrR family transcriptional regulator